MSDKVNYRLIMEFDDQSLSFAFGFQAGVIWQKTKSRTPFTEQFSGENLELIQRMPVRRNYHFVITEAGDNWYNLEATPLD